MQAPLANAIEATPRRTGLRPCGEGWLLRGRGERDPRGGAARRADRRPDRLTVGPEGRILVVDGRPAFGSAPGLERLMGEAAEYVVRAIRLDGPFWQVEVTPL